MKAKVRLLVGDPMSGWNFTDQPVPPNNNDVDYPSYEDPQGEMPVDDEDMRILTMIRLSLARLLCTSALTDPPPTPGIPPTR